jgi:CAAX prenyl protease-like protein
MAARRDHGWWPYLGPYGLFLILVELASRTPDSIAGWMLVVKAIGPAALLIAFASRGAYPELRGYRPGATGLLADIFMGLAIAALWMAPFVLLPDVIARLPEMLQPDPREAFDPGGYPPLGPDATLAVRLLGYAAVTPFVEELFVRSFLIRLVDVLPSGRDFRNVPIATFTLSSFSITVFWFTFSHVPWEWLVALPTGILFNLWLYRRRHIAAVVVAHAVANAAIWIAVVLAGDYGFFL